MPLTFRHSLHNQCCTTGDHEHKCSHNHAVKMKVAICACVILGAVLSVADAGSRVRVYTHAGRGWCPPLRPFCFPVHARVPVLYTVAPFYSYSRYYEWSQAPLVSSTTFSNVSPAFDSDETGVYRVPAPIIPPSPIINSPGPRFTWRH